MLKWTDAPLTNPKPVVNTEDLYNYSTSLSRSKLGFLSKTVRHLTAQAAQK